MTSVVIGTIFDCITEDHRTMATTLRSTSTLTTYVQTCDRIAALAVELKELQRTESQLRPDAMDQIGERRAVKVSGIVRVLEVSEKVSVSKPKAVSDETLVSACIMRGLPIDTRTPEYVSPAKLRKYAMEGALPDELIDISAERIIIIS
jgi:hypothetical protein